MIYLQSFFSRPLGSPISVARWQPKGVRYPTLSFFVPKRLDDTDIKKLPHKNYMEEYVKVLVHNFLLIFKFLEELKQKNSDYSICCWCNKERQEHYDKLFCHTILIGYLIEKIIPDYPVHYLEGRDDPIWSREEFYSEVKKYTK